MILKIITVTPEYVPSLTATKPGDQKIDRFNYSALTLPFGSGHIFQSLDTTNVPIPGSIKTTGLKDIDLITTFYK